MNKFNVWRVLIETSPRHAYANMAIDEVLLEGQIRGEFPPTVRFYRWQPPAISIGCCQNIETIDVAACQLNNIVLVRRITGGRAIFHKHDFTYSIAAREDNPVISGTIMETYRKISHALLAGMRELGVQAVLSPGEKKLAGSGAACFDAASRYELTAGGKKLIGSAQRRKQGAVLQQGSLPLEDTSEMLFNLLKFKDQLQRLQARENYKKKATSLAEVLGRVATFSEVAAALLKGMADVFGIKLIPGGLSPEEVAQVEILQATKYASPDWNLFGERKKNQTLH